jgi:methylation protein EvaC
VLLNYCGIGTDLLSVVVDSTPQKIGRFMPGTHQPIIDSSELRRQHPDAALILAGNHIAEIREKEAAYINSGGRLITCPMNLD